MEVIYLALKLENAFEKSRNLKADDQITIS